MKGDHPDPSGREAAARKAMVARLEKADVADLGKQRLRLAAAREREIHKVVDKHAPAVYRLARRAFDAGRAAIDKKLLRHGLQHHNEMDVRFATQHAATVVRHALQDTEPIMLRMLQDGGREGARYINSLPRRRAASLRTAADTPLIFKFNPKNPRLAKLAEDHAARLVTQVSDTTEQRIREAITKEFTGEYDEGEAYDAILDAVGDDARAEMIERTESMLVVHAGQREAWSDAIDEGYLSPDARRVWITTGDNVVCPECEALDGKTADLDGMYDADVDGPPLHPSCRCTEGLDV